ncbi:MAG: hypothetical protein HXY23_04025 [Parvularculaceae bacterium]|nr:hypothetical protein [Parvularculaceae bacterium]
MAKKFLAVLASSVVVAAASAQAAVINIEAGQPTVNVPAFDTANDLYRIFADTFGVSGDIVFQNVLASGGNVLDDVNVIVLQNADDDDNSATAFNARSAATLIANNTNADRAGFFVYFNSVLNINRLVFTPNLNDALAAFTILAANQSPTGADAIALLPTFSVANFEFSEVPLPGALPLFIAGLGAGGLAAARRSRKPA